MIPGLGTSICCGCGPKIYINCVKLYRIKDYLSSSIINPIGLTGKRLGRGALHGELHSDPPRRKLGVALADKYEAARERESFSREKSPQEVSRPGPQLNPIARLSEAKLPIWTGLEKGGLNGPISLVALKSEARVTKEDPCPLV